MRWAVAILTFGAAQGSSLYSVVDLGNYGGTTSLAVAINQSGAATGTAATPNGTQVVFTTDAGAKTTVDANAIAAGINDTGSVVGTSYSSGSPRATEWHDGIANQILGVDSYAFDINDNRDIVGTHMSGTTMTAFIESNGTITDIPAGGTWSAAYGINKSGLVTGTIQNASGTFSAFSWNKLGGTVGLGSLGGANSYGKDISNTGLIAGVAQTVAGYLHGLLYDGTMKDLGTLGGTASGAYGVNDFGKVVGYSFDELGQSRAFVWFGGTMFDLNAMLPDSSGWLLQSAYGINDAGQIVGTGIYNGQVSAFRLDPVFNELSLRLTSDGGLSASPASVPEPNTFALGGLAVLGFMLLRLRRNQ